MHACAGGQGKAGQGEWKENLVSNAGEGSEGGSDSVGGRGSRRRGRSARRGGAGQAAPWPWC
jgi:hypothetical protein